jgi:hypothetical protein
LVSKWQRELSGKIVRINDRLVGPAHSGYRDILLNVKMSNGHIAKFRLHLATVDQLAEIEHATYEIKRSMEAISPQELTEEQRALAAALNAAAFDDAVRKAGGIIP